ncbi:siderophore-interacting protein [Salinisphaera sp.]|uniref:siderophore-interacting protein n=1 Tax=Salinisphaera sp. TaxID=1914330 RepID=UPI000C4296EE|nr:siderophore-interacting protein [Salinisphaera sp.]MBS62596.1 NADPH-dependent ferric siderophore reductase [Salinisphaera sp.]
MSARGPWPVQVTDVARLSPSLLRVELAGENGVLAGFADDRAGAHLKIFLPQPGEATPALPEFTPDGPRWPQSRARAITRTYSARYFDKHRQRLYVDFVLHGDDGPASAWARRARVGDTIGVAGPGGPSPMLAPVDRVLLAGDITALPAIAALLESLPAHVCGHAIVQLPDDADRPVLDYAASITIDWLQAPHVDHGDTPMVRALKALEPPTEPVAAWVAGENASILAMRAHLRDVWGLTRQQIYAVPYWKARANEEAYHAERHRVMDNFDS